MSRSIAVQDAAIEELALMNRTVGRALVRRHQPDEICGRERAFKLLVEAGVRPEVALLELYASGELGEIGRAMPRWEYEPAQVAFPYQPVRTAHARRAVHRSRCGGADAQGDRRDSEWHLRPGAGMRSRQRDRRRFGGCSAKCSNRRSPGPRLSLARPS
jgi:hypothetical protein